LALGRDNCEGDFEFQIGAPIRSVERNSLTLLIVCGSAHNIIHVRYKKVDSMAYLDSVGSDVSFEFIGWCAFFKSFRVESKTVGVGRSVCLGLLGEVGILGLGEFCEYIGYVVIRQWCTSRLQRGC